MSLEIEISPEPTSAEREALQLALATLDAPAGDSAWWEAGIRESVEDEPEEL